MTQFHAQGIGETLHRMFRGRVHALVGERQIGRDRPDIDQSTAVLPQMSDRHQRTVDRTPEVGEHQALVIFLLTSSSRP